MAIDDQQQISLREADESGATRLLAEAAGAAVDMHARLDSVIVDLFLPDGGRLRDVQRVMMAQLLAKLVRAVEDDVRHRLIGRIAGPSGAAIDAALGAEGIEIVTPALLRAGVLRDAEFVAALLRRADEHRLGRALRIAAARAVEGDSLPIRPLIDELLPGDDPELAEAAMAYLVADSRRFDRFQDPLLARTDLSAELQHRLVWWAAAALRDYLIRIHRLPAATADDALTQAATQSLAGYDEGATLESRAMQLARLLNTAGRLDDAIVARALAEGRLALVAAGLAVRAGIPFAPAWDMLVEPEGDRLVVLLRAVGATRAAAADIVLRLVQANGGDGSDGGAGVAARMEAFDALNPGEARSAILLWRLDDGYRRAIAQLSAGEIAA